MDGAAINNHHLVDILLGIRVLAEGDDTGALATDKVDAVHHAKRREGGEDIFLEETGWFSALDCESHFPSGTIEDGGQLNIKTEEKFASGEERHSGDVPGLEVDGSVQVLKNCQSILTLSIRRFPFSAT